MEDKKYEVHVVPETHWDREWYSSFETYRVRLVRLTDKLLGILNSGPDYKYFVFDGQTVVLEDYLEIHPEKRENLEKLVKERRLFVGPWYILPDEFLVSGEALVRNLLLGHKIASSFGHVMKAGYIPDPFGHISQLPQILNGFGIDSVIFMRGMGRKEALKLGREFIWESPGGGSALAICYDYGNARALGYIDNDTTGSIINDLNLEEALKKARETIGWHKGEIHTNCILFNNGVDHYEPQKELPRIIKYLNENSDNAVFIHSNYEDYLNKVRASAVQLQRHSGEMRKAYHTYVLPDVISTRMYLKQLNDKCQNLLEKYTEPLSSFAYLEKGRYNQDIILQAWKYLLKCHPHDSICGCSIDAVHRDMLRRFAWIEEICALIGGESMLYLYGKIDKKQREKNHIPVVIFNTLGWDRENEPVEVKIRLSTDNKLPGGYDLLDSQSGVRRPAEITGHKMTYTTYSDGMHEVAVRFMADKIPACGYKTYFLVPLDSSAGKTSVRTRKTGVSSIENEFYRISANKNGTIRITDRKTKRVYNNMLMLEDTEDAGDEYNYSCIEKTKRFSTAGNKANVSVTGESPSFSTLEIKSYFVLPEGLTDDRKGRSKKTIKCSFTNSVTLYPGLDRIDIKTVFDNKARDHRLRVLFPSGIRTKHSFSEGHFDVIKRPLKPDPDDYFDSEKPAPTFPQKSFTCINDGINSLALLNRGLPECEAFETKKGVTLALTLLRCVGFLSRNDLLARKGNAGPFIGTPEAQCQGEHEFNYSLVIGGKSWEEGKLWKRAHSYTSPLAAIAIEEATGDFMRRVRHEYGFNVILDNTGKPAPVTLGNKMSFIRIEPDNLVISAIKKAEENDNLILRLYNTVGKNTAGRVRFYKDIKSARAVNLNEEPSGKKVDIVELKTVEFEAGPFEIVTLEIETGS